MLTQQPTFRSFGKSCGVRRKYMQNTPENQAIARQRHIALINQKPALEISEGVMMWIYTRTDEAVRFIEREAPQYGTLRPARMVTNTYNLWVAAKDQPRVKAALLAAWRAQTVRAIVPYTPPTCAIVPAGPLVDHPAPLPPEPLPPAPEADERISLEAPPPMGRYFMRWIDWVQQQQHNKTAADLRSGDIFEMQGQQYRVVAAGVPYNAWKGRFVCHSVQRIPRAGENINPGFNRVREMTLTATAVVKIA